MRRSYRGGGATGEEELQVRSYRGGGATGEELLQGRSYLTCGSPSSLDQDEVDGNEGRDEEAVTDTPLCV